MTFRLTQRKAFVILLLAISILSITSTRAHADQQSASGMATINATGQATAIGSGPSGTTTLNLTGVAYMNTNQWLIMQNMTGSLAIGSSRFTITNGQGSVNSFGDIAIFAQTNPGGDQLMLHGTAHGSSVTFDSPSQLTSEADLSLSGTINQSNVTTSLPVSSQAMATNADMTVTSPTNQTEVSNSTMSSTSMGNSTYENSTQTISSQTSTANSTGDSQQTVSGANGTASNGIGNAPNSPAASGTVTVTVTQYFNQTMSTTQTVANVTISYTITATVANMTVTETNATSTVTATT